MEDLLTERIKLLKQEILDLRKEKVSVCSDMNVVRNEINICNDKNSEIQNINDTLTLENTELSLENKHIDEIIASLHKKEANILINIDKSDKTLKTLVLRVSCVNRDIDNLNNENSSLIITNYELNNHNTEKKKELHKLHVNITKSEIELDNVKKNIDHINKRESNLDIIENNLLIKDSILNKKEIRLKDLKKFLLSKR